MISKVISHDIKAIIHA